MPSGEENERTSSPLDIGAAIGNGYDITCRGSYEFCVSPVHLKTNNFVFIAKGIPSGLTPLAASARDPRRKNGTSSFSNAFYLSSTSLGPIFGSGQSVYVSWSTPPCWLKIIAFITSQPSLRGCNPGDDEAISNREIASAILWFAASQ